MQPSPWSDTVGDVGELVRSVDLDKVLEDSGLDQIGVELSHTIHLVRTDDSQVCHANHLWLRLLDDRNSSKHVSVLGEASFDLLEEVQIDLVDDLMSRILVMSFSM